MAKHTSRKTYLRPASVVIVISAEEHLLKSSTSGSTEDLYFYNEYDADGEQLSKKKGYWWSDYNEL